MQFHAFHNSRRTQMIINDDENTPSLTRSADGLCHNHNQNLCKLAANIDHLAWVHTYIP